MAAAILETWRAGPMGYDWEHLTDAQCHRMDDIMCKASATQLRKEREEKWQVTIQHH